MKKFIYRFLGLLLFLFLSAWILDKFYTYIYMNKSPRSKASFLVQNKVKDVDYIFLGSSRVQNHINTKLVEDKTSKSAINLGVQGANLNDLELFLNLIVQNDIRFNKIFLQIDYNYNHTNFSKVSGVDVIPFINDVKIVDRHLKRYNENYIAYKYIPFYKYAVNDFRLGFREMVMLISNRGSRIDYKNGFDPLAKNGKNLSYSLPNNLTQKNPSFTRIDSIAKINNINITYFMAPFCKNTTNSNFGSLLSKRIKDFKDYSRTIMKERYFKDCAHLNKKGADVFTEILIDDLKL